MKTQKENPNGLHQRYHIQKLVPTSTEGKIEQKTSNGECIETYSLYRLEEVDKDAEYFVLRLDKGGSDYDHIKACRIAAHAYADAIQNHLPQLAAELKEKYPLLKKTPQEIKKIWGDDLYRAFQEHFDEEGWLTSEWGQILEDNFSDWDEDYNDTGKKRELYQLMYFIDYEENEDATKIRCTEHWH